MNPGGEPDVEVGRSYTRARKFPLVIGKVPGGGRIFGGPYTLSQIGVMAGTVVVLFLSTPLWAHLGYGDGAVYLVVPYSLAWTVRHAKAEGREPLRTAAGIFAQLGAPGSGRLRGRSWREPRPVMARARAFSVGAASAAPEPRRGRAGR